MTAAGHEVPAADIEPILAEIERDDLGVPLLQTVLHGSRDPRTPRDLSV